MKRFLLIFWLFLFHCSFGQIGYSSKGKASYYAHDFHGRHTANGELFDMESLTAAHQTLPFNSLVRVTNLTNNRSIVVRINDRGPYFKNRMLDLSRSAAHKLGIVANGTAHVAIKVIGIQKKSTVRKALAKNESKLNRFAKGNVYDRKGTLKQLEGFGVQIGAFKDKINALSACMRFESKGLESHIKVYENGDERLYRIVIGCCATEESAEMMHNQLKKKGWSGFVVKLG